MSAEVAADEQVTFCRVCNALEPKAVCLTCQAAARPGCTDAEHVTQNGEWLAALPDGVRGPGLIGEAWCSHECMHADPQFREHRDGADLADLIERFSEACGRDIVGAISRSRGVSREEARGLMVEGADRVVRGKRKR